MLMQPQQPQDRRDLHRENHGWRAMELKRAPSALTGRSTVSANAVTRSRTARIAAFTSGT
jgi:hypothetical protein